MKNIKDVRQRLRENPDEYGRICSLSGLAKGALKRKLYNPKKFTLYEVIAFKRVMALSMDETIKIFAPFVANSN